MSDKTLGAYNIEDLRAIAQRRVPRGVFEFCDRGSEGDTHRNRQRFTHRNPDHGQTSGRGQLSQ